ncbi:multiple epidermal growth factor-like domains protein 6 [Scyliorhinus canicula]|uniref:multiple epidermal growth factor-like domains protein 6 n=1 Tax=Scyliorhinus canicula TaxID=7830 RepID=UPI0018F5A97B|nr:multiple epidermal growth factor-like domains protein 6 [Scyliorhinus canicula]
MGRQLSRYQETVGSLTNFIWLWAANCPRPQKPRQLKRGEDSFSKEDFGSVSCDPCLLGHYCDSERTSWEVMSTRLICPAGMVCPAGLGRVPDPSKDACPVGYYCLQGNIDPNPRACPNGTYGDQEGLVDKSQCVPCPAGEYCYTEGTKPVAITQPTGRCPGGHYCPLGTGDPYTFPCAPGFYRTHSSAERKDNCSHCPPGHYCDTFGLEEPKVCPEGFYCIKGSKKPQPCEPGTYSNRIGLGAFSGCSPCGGGQYCTDEGLTQPTGYCKAGFYCRERAASEGYYLHQKGAEDIASCKLCDLGMYCSEAGLTAPEGPCQPGYYCTRGSNSSTPVEMPFGNVCPAGYYCPSGTKHAFEKPCPTGTWNNATGAQEIALCLPCIPGYACSGMALAQPIELCAPGFYCKERAKSTRPVDGETGDLCPEGHYCPEGTAIPLRCGDGYYNNVTDYYSDYCELDKLKSMATSETIECLKAHFSHHGIPNIVMTDNGPHFISVDVENPNGNLSTGVGGPCPMGHYCPAGTSISLPCPMGTYSDKLYLSVASNCTVCSPGMYCGSTGLIKPSGLCDPGFFCLAAATTPTPLDSDDTGGLCPVSHYCSSGTVQPMGCPAGTYNNLSGQARCFPCALGYFCPENTTTYSDFPCPAGFYCPNGTKHATEFPCPRGYYNPEPMTQSVDSCLPCPPGHYCEKEKLTGVSGKCKAGWFCVSAAWTSQPFDLDNYTTANCLCPATATGGKCQAGFYCPEGSIEPTACPPGAYCNDSGLAEPSGECSPGYYCRGGATQPQNIDGITGNICPRGSYCGPGSGEPIPCPVGTFSDTRALSDVSECLLCTAGFSCDLPGLTAPTKSCSEGFFCPPGQNVSKAFACPPGHYCPEGSANPKLCDSGSWQDLEGQVWCKPCEAAKSKDKCETFELVSNKFSKEFNN